MAKSEVFRFVHIRPPYQPDQLDQEKSKPINNDEDSSLLEEAERKTKEEDISFEESRVDAAKEHIFSNKFIVKDDFYSYEGNITKVKELVKKKLENSDFDIIENLTSLLPIESNNATEFDEHLNSISSKMWDSYYALSLVPHKKSKELLPKSIFWTKVFQLFKFSDNEEQLSKYVSEFDNYKPALNSSFYVNPLLKRVSKVNQEVKTDPLLERKKKIKEVSAEIGELSQLKEKIEDLKKQKENKLQPPIAPYSALTKDQNLSVDQKELKKYNQELANYQNKLKTTIFFDKKDFSENERLLLNRNQIIFENLSKVDIDKKIDTKISSLIAELNNLSFIERVTIKNGRFVKTLKRIAL